MLPCDSALVRFPAAMALALLAAGCASTQPSVTAPTAVAPRRHIVVAPAVPDTSALLLPNDNRASLLPFASYLDPSSKTSDTRTQPSVPNGTCYFQRGAATDPFVTEYVVWFENGKIVAAHFLETMPHDLLNAELAGPARSVNQNEWTTLTAKDIDGQEEYPVRMRVTENVGEVVFAKAEPVHLACSFE